MIYTAVKLNKYWWTGNVQGEIGQNSKEQILTGKKSSGGRRKDEAITSLLTEIRHKNEGRTGKFLHKKKEEEKAFVNF